MPDPTSQFRDHYRELGVAPDASYTDVRQAWREAAKRWHPDINRGPDAEETMKRINEAWNVLSDARRRSEYDLTYQQQQSGTGQVGYRRESDVDFSADGDWARGAHRSASPAGTYPKSKVAAALFAFFLGGFGAHKFYLGYTGPGVALLISTIVGIVTAIVVIGVIVLFVVGIIVLIEFFIYVFKSEEDFHQTYVVGRRNWF